MLKSICYGCCSTITMTFGSAIICQFTDTSPEVALAVVITSGVISFIPGYIVGYYFARSAHNQIESGSLPSQRENNLIPVIKPISSQEQSNLLSLKNTNTVEQTLTEKPPSYENTCLAPVRKNKFPLSMH